MNNLKKYDNFNTFKIIIDGEIYMHNPFILSVYSEMINTKYNNIHFQTDKDSLTLDSKSLGISKENIIKGLDKLYSLHNLSKQKNVSIKFIFDTIEIYILYKYLLINTNKLINKLFKSINIINPEKLYKLSIKFIKNHDKFKIHSDENFLLIIKMIFDIYLNNLLYEDLDLYIKESFIKFVCLYGLYHVYEDHIANFILDDNYELIKEFGLPTRDNIEIKLLHNNILIIMPIFTEDETFNKFLVILCNKISKDKGIFYPNVEIHLDKYDLKNFIY